MLTYGTSPASYWITAHKTGISIEMRKSRFGNSLGKSVTILLTYSKRLPMLVCDSTFSKLNLSSCTKGFISSSNGYLATSYLSKNWCVKGSKKNLMNKFCISGIRSWLPGKKNCVWDSCLWLHERDC